MVLDSRLFYNVFLGCTVVGFSYIVYKGKPTTVQPNYQVLIKPSHRTANSEKLMNEPINLKKRFIDRIIATI